MRQSGIYAGKNTLLIHQGLQGHVKQNMEFQDI